jgi:hypothetical protein
MNRIILRLIPAILPTILLAGLLIAAAPAQAMGQEIAEKVANRQTDRMKTELNLNADQAQKVSEINLTEARKFHEMFVKYRGSADKKGMIKAALEINRSRESQLQKVLTPQQWQTRQANRSERAARMMTRMITLQLNLTDEQIPQVEQINLEAARVILGGLGGPAALQGRPAREKLRTVADIRSTMEDRDQSLQKVLTPEQWRTYEQDREEMREIMRERLGGRRRK